MRTLLVLSIIFSCGILNADEMTAEEFLKDLDSEIAEDAKSEETQVSETKDSDLVCYKRETINEVESALSGAKDSMQRQQKMIDSCINYLKVAEPELFK